MTEPPPSVQNPYAAASDLVNEPTQERPAAGASLTAARRMGTWQIFFGMMLILLFGCVVLFLGLPLFLGTSGGSSVGMGVIGAGAVGGLVVLVTMSIFYLLPAIVLLRAGGTARQFGLTPDEVQRTAFLKSQLRVWRILGSLAILACVFSLLAVLLSLSTVRISQTRQSTTDLANSEVVEPIHE